MNDKELFLAALRRSLPCLHEYEEHEWRMRCVKCDAVLTLPAPPAAEIERRGKQDGLAELRAPLTRDLPEKNEEVWAAGMNAIRDMLCDLERDDFKDIGNGYPAAIWAAMCDAAELKKGK